MNTKTHYDRTVAKAHVIYKWYETYTPDQLDVAHRWMNLALGKYPESRTLRMISRRIATYVFLLLKRKGVLPHVS